jgi:hypothetical protein
MPKWLKSLVTAVGGFLLGYFRGDVADLITKGVKQAGPYLQPAYQLVTIAVTLTPTRADDEILALVNRFGLSQALDLSIPPEERGPMIFDMVVNALKGQFPDAETRRLRRAVELIYGGQKP